MTNTNYIQWFSKIAKENNQLRPPKFCSISGVKQSPHPLELFTPPLKQKKGFEVSSEWIGFNSAGADRERGEVKLSTPLAMSTAHISHQPKHINSDQQIQPLIRIVIALNMMIIQYAGQKN